MKSETEKSKNDKSDDTHTLASNEELQIKITYENDFS